MSGFHPSSWLSVAATALAGPVAPVPLLDVAALLGRDLRAAGTWEVVVRADGGVDVALAWTPGPRAPDGAGARVRALAPGLAGPAGSRDVVVLDDGGASDGVRARAPSCLAVRAVVALPAGEGPRGRRWLVVGRSRPFDDADGDLLRLVTTVLAGLERLARADGPPPPADRPVPASSAVAVPPPVALTARERAVLTLMAQGLIGRAIGHRLGVSPRTVAKHQEHIYRKLDATDRLSAVLRAQQVGLVPPTVPG